MKSKKNIMRKLFRSQDGGVLMLVGLAFGVIVLASGFTIDFARAQIVRERLQWAIDAAALAGARVAHEGIGSVQQEANAYFRANFPNGYMGTRGGNISARNIGTVNGKGRGIEFKVTNMTMESYMVDAMGMNDIKVSGLAQVNTMPAGPHDIVLAVDVSGSMEWCESSACVYSGDPGCTGCGASSIRMYQAKQAMRIFLDEMQGGQDIRIGIVPWDQKVNAGGVALGKGTNSSTRMVANVSHTGNASPPTFGVASNVCTFAGCTPIRPMTFFRGNFNTIRNRIDDLQGEGNTDGALGMWWAMEMLRNGNTRNWVNWSRPADVKSIIFLTDGINTKYYGNPGVTSNAADGPFRNLCNTAKNQRDIQIYTIGYNLDHAGAEFAAARDVLKDCASRQKSCNKHPGNRGEQGNVCFFNSPSGADLRQAFRDIADSMMTMRLTR